MDQGKGCLHLAGKSTVISFLFVDTDSNDDQSSWAVFLVKFVEDWKRLPARTAPRRPDVDQYGLAGSIRNLGPRNEVGKLGHWTAHFNRGSGGEGPAGAHEEEQGGCEFLHWMPTVGSDT